MIANPLTMHLPGEPVSYPPKNIETVAFQVTAENIGALSIEFEAELRYNGDGRPYFSFQAERSTPQKQESPAILYVSPGDWIVVLWDQFRLFRENEFKNTFMTNHPVWTNKDEVVAHHIDDDLRGYVPDEGQQ